MKGLFGNDIPDKPEKKNKYPPEFESLWKAYGKKGAKAESHVEWKKLTQGMRPVTKKSWHEWIIDRAKLYRSIVPTDQFKFTKDLERWLKKGVYEFDAKALRQLYPGEFALPDRKRDDEDFIPLTPEQKKQIRLEQRSKP